MKINRNDAKEFCRTESEKGKYNYKCWIYIFYFDQWPLLVWIQKNKPHRNILFTPPWSIQKQIFILTSIVAYIARYGILFISHSFYGMYTKLTITSYVRQHIVPNFPHSTLHCIRQTELKRQSNILKYLYFCFLSVAKLHFDFETEVSSSKEVAQRFHKCFHSYIFTRQPCFNKRKSCDT